MRGAADTRERGHGASLFDSGWPGDNRRGSCRQELSCHDYVNGTFSPDNTSAELSHGRVRVVNASSSPRASEPSFSFGVCLHSSQHPGSVRSSVRYSASAWSTTSQIAIRSTPRCTTCGNAINLQTRTFPFSWVGNKSDLDSLSGGVAPVVAGPQLTLSVCFMSGGEPTEVTVALSATVRDLKRAIRQARDTPPIQLFCAELDEDPRCVVLPQGGRAGYAPTRVSRQSTGGCWAPLAGWGVHGELAALASSSRQTGTGPAATAAASAASRLPTRLAAARRGRAVHAAAGCCITMARPWPSCGGRAWGTTIHQQHVSTCNMCCLVIKRHVTIRHNRATRCDPVPRGCPETSPARGAILQSARGQMQMQVTEAILGTKLTRN
jgi:hypothetical protein